MFYYVRDFPVLRDLCNAPPGHYERVWSLTMRRFFVFCFIESDLGNSARTGLAKSTRRTAVRAGLVWSRTGLAKSTFETAARTGLVNIFRNRLGRSGSAARPISHQRSCTAPILNMAT